VIIRHIIYSGIATLASTILLGLSLSPATSYPLGIIVWGALQIAIFFQSLFLIKIFRPPRKKKETSTSAKDTTDTE